MDDAYSKEEKIISDVIINARKVQDFLWEGDNLRDYPFESSKHIWERVFQKRVDKIKEIKLTNPSAKTELKKRILQQAALSILALRILEESK
jgi:hypothetical protein